MSILEITDFDDPRLDIYARLNETQLLHYDEPEPGLFLAESALVIHRALDAGFEPVSLLVETKRLQSDAADLPARCGDIPIYTAQLEVINQLTGYALTRGVLCAMRRKKLPEAGALTQGMRRIAVLENVTNPANVGAIIRSAAALGMEAVLLTRECSDPLYRRALRVGMGTALQIPWTYLGEAGSEIWQLHELGFVTAAMALSGEPVSPDDARLSREERLAVLLGAEGDGLCDQTIRESDYIVRIPMQRGVDSLNVAAASAVVFWELSKSGTGLGTDGRE
ncbi:MAG: RNA methyltransferase [Lachnospiraceae bacterium]|nr:RNA methyltransferase [Lachnospiraceae bacterium]